MNYIKIFNLCLVISLLFQHSLFAKEFFSGKIINEDNQGVHNAELKIGDLSFMTNNLGEFKIPIAQIDKKQSIIMKINHPDYYPDIQAFALNEIAQNKYAPISLVGKKAGRSMLTFGGDAMMGRRFYENGYLKRGSEKTQIPDLLGHLKEIFSIGDFSSINLETAILKKAPKVGGVEKAYTFFSSPFFPKYLYNPVGISLFSLANNHVLDFGMEGLEETLKNLQKDDVPFTGAGLDKESSFRPYKTTINGQDVEFFSFIGFRKAASGYGQTSEDNPGGPPFSGLGNLEKYVGKAAKNSLIVTQLHGAREYTQQPASAYSATVKSAVNAGSDLIIGHGPHVIQGFNFDNNIFIAYSLGNFIFDQVFPETMRSFILRVWMDGKKFHRAQILPIVIKNYIPQLSVSNFNKNVLQTLSYLSNKNGVSLHATGAQAYILPPSRSAESPMFERLKFSSTLKGHIVSLKRMPWYATPKEVQYIESCEFSIGRDDLVTGNFGPDNFYDLDNEYFWNLTKAKIITDPEDSNANVLKMNQLGTAKISHALRVPSNKNWSVRFFVKSQSAGELNILIKEFDKKGKKIRQDKYPLKFNPTKALWDELSLLDWTKSKDTEKVLLTLELSNLSDSASDILIKDLNFIAWSDTNFACNSKISVSRADFIKFSNPVIKNKLSIIY